MFISFLFIKRTNPFFPKFDLLLFLKHVAATCQLSMQQILHKFTLSDPFKNPPNAFFHLLVICEHNMLYLFFPSKPPEIHLRLIWVQQPYKNDEAQSNKIKKLNLQNICF